MFKRVLIANRGEIACRVIKTLKRLGVVSIAVYSDPDINSRHVNLADEAYALGGTTALESYLNIDAIIRIAKSAGAEAIHPGYGFLSENTEFAAACLAAGIVFIGPSVEAMAVMASKQTAKQAVKDVPLIPGYHALVQDDATLKKAAIDIGFPVLLKPAAGGGGKGMRVVTDAAAFADAVKSARREAKRSFNDEVLLIEKYLNNPRHIEVQILADTHGNVLHLGERDCSVQRRHQKIVEEAPALGLDAKVRQKLLACAVKVAKTINYTNAGTVEFLLDAEQKFYFIEMNTRLQVEHPVTECVYGVDLVEWQLKIAAGEELPFKQEDLQPTGHAIECRIYAEDANFLPTAGTITALHEPTGVRIDTGVVAGDTITTYYDPMIAKLTVHGETRAQALGILQATLAEYHIGGLKNNLVFLRTLTACEAFATAHVYTNFLDEKPLKLPTPDPMVALQAVVCYDYLALRAAHPADTFAWSLTGMRSWVQSYGVDGVVFEVEVEVSLLSPLSLILSRKGRGDCTREYIATLRKFPLPLRERVRERGTHTTPLTWHTTTQRHTAWLEQTPQGITVTLQTGTVHITRGYTPEHAAKTNGHAGLTAPMPALVVAILKATGAKVTAGEPLVILEAMKMEHTLLAPHDGVLEAIFYTPGTQVAEGATLVQLTNAEPA